MSFRFTTLLGDLLEAIFAPIFQAIGAVFAAIIEFIASLLAPILEPLFAPIIEALVAAYMVAIGVIFALVWALIDALHMARFARGISFLGYAMAVLGLSFLTLGALGLHPWPPAQAGQIWTRDTVTGAIIMSAVSYIIGVAAAKTPQERAEQTERRPVMAQGPMQTAPVPKWPGVLGLIVIGAVVGGLAVWMLQPDAPTLPECTSEDRLRQAAADFLNERVNTRSADLMEPAPCQERSQLK